MPHFLISGTGDLAGEVSAVLRENGSTAVVVDDIDDVPRACVQAGGAAFDGYVQLPATFTVRGRTAIAAVHHFFADGVLARFPAMTAALPALRRGARVVFVLGALPPEVSTDDDVAARAALVRVLGHAARADGPDGLRISHLGSGSTPAEIALSALGRNPALDALAAGPAGGTYADWRVELLGMMSAEM